MGNYKNNDKINRNKHFTLVPIHESKETMKKYKELWSKTIDSMRSKTKNSMMIMMKNISKSNLIWMMIYF